MWKSKLLEFVKNFTHPAWGLTHFQRVYELAIKLVETQNLDVDRDTIFAAAYLHDIGAFDPYRQEGKDHSEVAVERCSEILLSIGFPESKIDLVKDIIKGHMFNVKPSEIKESLILHDADTLDFMGTIGISRILAIVGIEDWTPDLKSAIFLIQKFHDELPLQLYTTAAKELSIDRTNEMKNFLDNLAQQTNKFELV
ncbi:MAG: HD domain-containing protein [Candidatus Lokiarchaeota archaeon]|nr:HD domain-containing protein [Candidatus Lokiarchaeota archaeon]